MTTHFGLVIIGDEILSGKRVDKHLPKTIELLAERGLQLTYAEYVGDDPGRITATLARVFAAARESGDVVFSTGALVPRRTTTPGSARPEPRGLSWRCIPRPNCL